MSHSERSTPRGVAASGESIAAGPALHAVIVGGNDEVRLLLRGLLRLHHYQVEREVPAARPPPSAGTPEELWVLLLVVDGNGEEWSAELASALERQPGLRTLLITSETTPDLEARARSAGVRGVLRRPFSIRDLISTVEAVGRGEERFGPAVPPR
jgi:DNA-binding NarL/FixJ family response regulator